MNKISAYIYNGGICYQYGNNYSCSFLIIYIFRVLKINEYILLCIYQKSSIRDELTDNINNKIYYFSKNIYIYIK